MGKGRVVETERMLRLKWGNTEQRGGKLKNRNRFSGPNLRTGGEPRGWPGYLVPS